MSNQECLCQNLKPDPDEDFQEYCTECGRIWWLSFCGEDPHPTSMYKAVQKPWDGTVWVGHVQVKGPPFLVDALKTVVKK